jgi:hypothetical protein
MHYIQARPREYMAVLRTTSTRAGLSTAEPTFPGEILNSGIPAPDIAPAPDVQGLWFLHRDGDILADLEHHLFFHLATAQVNIITNRNGKLIFFRKRFEPLKYMYKALLFKRKKHFFAQFSWAFITPLNVFNSNRIKISTFCYLK